MSKTFENDPKLNQTKTHNTYRKTSAKLNNVIASRASYMYPKTTKTSQAKMAKNESKSLIHGRLNLILQKAV